MKNSIKFFNVLLAFIAFLGFNSCSFDDCKEVYKYVYYKPIYMTTAEVRNVVVTGPVNIENTGKIWVYGKYLLVNELYKGIHIFDNTDSSNPINLAYISIPGNIDMAVKDNVLYADNFIDLLSFDISDPVHPLLIDRREGVFNTQYINGQTGVYLVRYDKTDIVQETDCNDNRGLYYYEDGGIYIYDSQNGSNDQNPKINSSSGNISLGGSTARFTIAEDRLYTVDQNNINVFNILNPKTPVKVNTTNVGWNIETIFPDDKRLFIGSTNGMFVYSIDNPDYPSKLCAFSHAVACDPVYVKGDIAYITLRTGTRCDGTSNQLDLVDISDIQNPKLIKTYFMENPHGLSILDNKLVLCEGEFGVKVLDITDSQDVKKQFSMSAPNSFDVIILGSDDVIIVANDGIYQYKMEGYELKLLSKINVGS